jgi:hypothetical protein
MLAVIASLIFLATTSSDVVETLSDAAFAPVSAPLKITRVHYSPQEEEVYREYVYKDKDKIRIDVEYGDGQSYTRYVYDGKSGYIEGGTVTREASIEMILFGCTCGYLGGMEKVTSVYHEGVDAVYATGKQGNELYLNTETKLPLRYEHDTRTAVFDEYTEVEGIGLMPFLIVEMRLNEIVEITRIAGVERRVSLPRNFFSVPQQEVETLN